MSHTDTVGEAGIFTSIKYEIRRRIDMIAFIVTATAFTFAALRIDKWFTDRP